MREVIHSLGRDGCVEIKEVWSPGLNREIGKPIWVDTGGTTQLQFLFNK